MLSTLAVIGICVAASVSFLLTGSVLAVWFLRIRDRRRTNSTSLISRGLNTYHRAHLSIDGFNYNHIQHPRTSVRRSAQRTYGVVTEMSSNWTEVPSQESLRPQQMTSIEEQAEIDDLDPAPKRKRSLRQTIHGNPLNRPKTRRQKKTEKAIAQNSIPLSPLSAITEFTDHSQCTTPTVAELPIRITPRQTPDKIHDDRPWGRPASIQWPLPLALRRSKDTPDTVVRSIPARDSILMRKGSMDTTIQTERPVFGRSISMTSSISNVPADPLPPLPLRNIQAHSQQDYEAVRNSHASMDTIGSSVLGSVSHSPTQTITYTTTPNIDLGSPGLHQFSPARARGSHSAITVGLAAGKRAQKGSVSGSGTHSFRASIDEHATMRKISNSKTIDRSDQQFKSPYLLDDSFKTIDARNWKSDLPSRAMSHRTTLDSSLTAPVARRQYDTTRHSMLEHLVPSGKRASNPMETSAGEILTGSPRHLARPRPASVASGNPYQWDLRPPTLISMSPLPLKKGHKRQNCVRISNLPAIDPNRNSKLPEMMEEEEDDDRNRDTRIPGLTLLDMDNGTPALRARASIVNIKASPSPFHNPPLLSPTSRRKASHRRIDSTEFQEIPHSDSDVFMNSQNDPTTPTIFDGRRSGPRNWPVSPTPRNSIKLNPTTSAFSAFDEPQEPNSPMLPSPELTSATLFPRKPGVPQGPRTAPVSTSTSRNASPSPLNGRAGQKPRGDELRRSVMMLRHNKSEGKLIDQANRLYHDMGEPSVNFSLPSPPSQSNVELVSRSTSQMHGCSSISDKRRGSNMALNVISISRSKMSMAASPSTMSIWDDASVCDEADLEMRNSMMHIPEQTTLGEQDPEAYENFLGQRQQYIGRTPSDRKDRERENKLTSPQGQGLGIIHWGTPGSLYDKDGFLKEQ